MPLRLVYMGTPEFAVPTLSAIVSGGHEIVAVYTRAPKPAGRGMELTPSPILAGVSHGCFNLHASLLPRWRGAAPINRAVMAGDTETGVMVMEMDEGLDTGPIALAEHVPIGADMTAGELHDVLAPLGADLMLRALAALKRGSLILTPQPDTGITYTTKIEKDETRIG